MRAIKFRGICVIKNEMLHGNLNVYKGAYYICSFEDNTMREVDSITVGQFTGLKDKNGVEVFEGDAISDHVGVGCLEYAIKFAGFRVNYFGNTKAKWFYDYTDREQESIEVIGNIHQHPELIKGE